MRQPSRSTGELLAHDVTVFENGQLAVWPSRAQWAWALRRRPSSWVSTVPCLCTTEVTRLSDVQYTGEESAVLCLLVNVNIQHPWDTPELLVQCAGSHSLFDPLDYAVFRTVAHHTTDRHPRDRLLPPLSSSLVSHCPRLTCVVFLDSQPQAVSMAQELPHALIRGHCTVMQ